MYLGGKPSLGAPVACVETSPISFVAREKKGSLSYNKGLRRRLHVGKRDERRSQNVGVGVEWVGD